MLATLAFGLVLIGAIAAFVVIADSGMRSWSALKAMQSGDAQRKDPVVTAAKRRSIPQRVSAYRPLENRTATQRAA